MLLALLSLRQIHINLKDLKGYPHSMMRRAYLRMKFSSLKMKRDRVLEAPMPGRLMLLALLATFRRLFSWLPSRGPSSPPPESADSPAILKYIKDKTVVTTLPILWPLGHFTLGHECGRSMKRKQLAQTSVVMCKSN